MTDPAARASSGGPMLSVVIPVYNAEKFLVRCLNSVTGSTFTDFEVICVDDGSQDNSLQILRDFAEKDPRFRILTQDHCFAGAARNAGIGAASGKYIHFLDADDEIEPYAYEKWLESMEAAGGDVCECLYSNIDSETGRLIEQPKYEPYEEGIPISLLSGEKSAISLLRGHVVPWNKLYLKSFLTDNGILFDNLICAEDRAFYFEVILKARKIIRIPLRLVKHRVGNHTYLDGSNIRFRHFDVEFKSFERIWSLVESSPDFVRKQVLDCCIGDSFYYYYRSIGTEYDQPIRRMLMAYWPPYLPLLGNMVYRSWWYLLYRIIAVAEKHRSYGEFLLFVFSRLYRMKKLRFIAKAFSGILAGLHELTSVFNQGQQ